MSPKPGGPAMPTTEEVMGWDEDALFDWILQNEPRLVKDDRAEIFKKAAITGGIFVKYADNRDFFKECGLPMGVSDRLAELASELAGGEAVSIVQKRKEQDTSTSKSTNHAPFIVLFTANNISRAFFQKETLRGIWRYQSDSCPLSRKCPKSKRLSPKSTSRSGTVTRAAVQSRHYHQIAIPLPRETQTD
jgi:hypothetical protein